MKRFPHIAFCGMDGAGKSTLGHQVEIWLTNHGMPVEFIHGHTYSGSSNSFNMTANDVGRYRLLFRCLVPLALLDNFFTYLKKYRSIVSSKCLVTDRYFYDKVCRLLFYGIITRSMARWYLKLLPKPDIAFFLDLDSEIAFERKGEYSLAEYEIFRQNYRFVATEVGAILIGTGDPFDVCWGRIQTVLEQHPAIVGKKS